MDKYSIDKGQAKTIRKPDEEEGPVILEEIEIEDLSIDGICGVY